MDYKYENYEKFLMFIFTSFSNLSALSAMAVIWNKKLYHMYYACLMTFIASVMYHSLESLDIEEFILS